LFHHMFAMPMITYVSFIKLTCRLVHKATLESHLQKVDLSDSTISPQELGQDKVQLQNLAQEHQY
jgi:hypothetical protein